MEFIHFFTWTKYDWGDVGDDKATAVKGETLNVNIGEII